MVTVGSIHGGTKHNIIPDEVTAPADPRAPSATRSATSLIEGSSGGSNGLAQAHRAPEPDRRGRRDDPADGQHARAWSSGSCRCSAGRSASRTSSRSSPSMGAEDFGLFGRGGVPTFMFRLGAIPPERIAEARAKGERCPRSTRRCIRPDAPPALRVGIPAMTAAVQELLPKKP